MPAAKERQSPNVCSSLKTPAIDFLLQVTCDLEIDFVEPPGGQGGMASRMDQAPRKKMWWMQVALGVPLVVEKTGGASSGKARWERSMHAPPWHAAARGPRG